MPGCSSRRLRLIAPTILAACLALGSSCLFEPVDLGGWDAFGNEFELVWQTADEIYPAFVASSVDWQALYDEYSPVIDTVTTHAGALQAISDMFAPLQDYTIVLFSSEGFYLPYAPELDPNYDWDVLVSYLLPAQFEYFQEDYWGGCMFDSIPYVMIHYWFELSPDLLDVFLAAHPDAPALIIDIRMNNGFIGGAYWNEEPLLGEVARRFNDVMRTGFFAVGRSGPGHGDLYLMPRMIPRRTEWFDRPVAVLVGGENMLLSEEFACMVTQLPNAVLIGDTTAGQASLHYESFALPGGWIMNLPDSTILMADSTTWVHGRGVPPDIHVEATEDQFAQGIDPVLEYAIKWAGSR